MQEAMDAANNGGYSNVEEWLQEVISDSGHVVEMWLNHYAIEVENSK